MPQFLPRHESYTSRARERTDWQPKRSCPCGCTALFQTLHDTTQQHQSAIGLVFYGLPVFLHILALLEQSLGFFHFIPNLLHPPNIRNVRPRTLGGYSQAVFCTVRAQEGKEISPPALSVRRTLGEHIGASRATFPAQQKTCRLEIKDPQTTGFPKTSVSSLVQE